ncbi:hypothetical protein K435DRAFT_861830 [Dendrothele bispora CBS 962.96]|uniref:Uncharacterized protein n=1 Tax=Dendrothele bispora (strain CBS 962.96) TaxID=1314807 RepID=A0A4S8LUB1_DENBC|nr:hypothetical protein K435DRAFT_861830 [Dendrothele bispora CBS 962.96]
MNDKGTFCGCPNCPPDVFLSWQVCRDNRNGNMGRIFVACDRYHPNPPNIMLTEAQRKCGYFRWKEPHDGELPYILSPDLNNYLPPPPPPPTQPPSQPPSRTTGKALCPVCNKKNTNTSCRNNACKSCCIQFGGCTTVYDHRGALQQMSEFFYDSLTPNSTLPSTQRATSPPPPPLTLSLTPTSALPPTQSQKETSPTPNPPSSSQPSRAPLTQAQPSNDVVHRFSIRMLQAKRMKNDMFPIDRRLTPEHSQLIAKAAATSVMVFGWVSSLRPMPVEVNSALVNGTVSIDEELVGAVQLQGNMVEFFCRKVGIQPGVMECEGLEDLRRNASSPNSVDVPGPLGNRRTAFKDRLDNFQASTLHSRRSQHSKRPASKTPSPSSKPKQKRSCRQSPISISSSSPSPPPASPPASPSAPIVEIPTDTSAGYPCSYPRVFNF